MLAFTVALEAGAALLAVFTVGASEVLGNAAVVARIALAGTRVTAILARTIEVAANVGSKLMEIGQSIGRVSGLLSITKTVKTLAYVGSKSPSWLKLTTGLAFNTGSSIGIDALANGGKITNLHGDLIAGASPFGLAKVARDLKTANVAGTKLAAGAGALKEIALPTWVTKRTPYWLQSKLKQSGLLQFEKNRWAVSSRLSNVVVE